MSNLKKGLMCDIMGSDCTNGGVTSGVDHVVLIGDGIAEIFSDHEDMPAVALDYDLEPQGCAAGQLTLAKPRWLEELGKLKALKDFHAIAGIDEQGRDYCGQHRMVRVVARPIDEQGNVLRGGMFGGNWIESCDSRFPTTAPIPVHDRFES